MFFDFHKRRKIIVFYKRKLKIFIADNFKVKKIISNIILSFLINLYFVLKSAFFGVFFIILIVYFDLYSKNYVFELLHYYAIVENNQNPQIYFNQYLSFVYVQNNGISFGLFDNFANGKMIFAILQASIAFVLLFFMIKAQYFHLTIAFSLIIGGAFGNVIDRLQNGAVTDFIDFHIAGYHWPAFNLADSAIFLGVMILLACEIFFKKSKL